MEILFLLFYELTKLTEGLDHFQITKKSGVVKRNELFNLLSVIQQRPYQTALIPALKVEKIKQTHTYLVTGLYLSC